MGINVNHELHCLSRSERNILDVSDSDSEGEKNNETISYLVNKLDLPGMNGK